MDTSRERRRNKRWPEALKREIVAATLAPGASVSVVARQYDVNANQVFGWRRRYRDAGAAVPNVVLDARACAGDDHAEPEARQRLPWRRLPSETIEIDVSGDYRVRVGSSFDARALRRVLDVLKNR